MYKSKYLVINVLKKDQYELIRKILGVIKKSQGWGKFY